MFVILLEKFLVVKDSLLVFRMFRFCFDWFGVLSIFYINFFLFFVGLVIDLDGMLLGGLLSM